MHAAGGLLRVRPRPHNVIDAFFSQRFDDERFFDQFAQRRLIEVRMRNTSLVAGLRRIRVRVNEHAGAIPRVTLRRKRAIEWGIRFKRIRRLHKHARNTRWSSMQKRMRTQRRIKALRSHTKRRRIRIANRIHIEPASTQRSGIAPSARSNLKHPGTMFPQAFYERFR